MTVYDLARALETWAPAASAQSYDNVGLQVGRPLTEVDRVLVALDLTQAVLDEAVEIGAQLVVTHHPLIFRPLKRLVPGSYAQTLALKLAEQGIALYACHTNLDAAPAGVSFALAEQLGLEETAFLESFPGALVKLVTFVPGSHAEAVRLALAEAGAGRIGDYDACSFETPGTGHFRALEGTNPYIGEAGGGIEDVDEIRIEAQVPRWSLRRAIAAMELAHPYEEVAYDVYPLDQPYSGAGLGVVGDLPEPELLSAFLERVTHRLGTPAVRYAGNPDMQISRVAVCGGAGRDLIGKAVQAGADAYVTADLTYHTFFEVLTEKGTPGMALIDAGHYETEAVTEQLLVDWLSERFTSVEFVRTQHRTSPIDTWVSEG